MRVVADECVHDTVVEALRREGHDVTWIREYAPASRDDVVLRTAVEMDAVLVTVDKDFGELIFRRGLASRGVVLIRLAGLETQERAMRVAALLRDHSDELTDSFTVITERTVRIRRR